MSDISGTTDTAVLDTATDQIDNQIDETVDTDTDDSGESVDTTLDAEQIGGDEGTATGDKPKTYKELREFYKTAEPTVKEYEQNKSFLETARQLGPEPLIQELTKLATPPQFTDESQWSQYTGQALDTILTLAPHLSGRLEPELGWRYIRDPASQPAIVQEFFPGLTPDKLTELVTAYQGGRIDDEWLAQNEPDPAIVAANQKAQAAEDRATSVEQRQIAAEAQEIADTYTSEAQAIIQQVSAPVGELIEKFKLAPLPNDKPEVRAMKERVVDKFRKLADSVSKSDAVATQKWQTMNARIQAQMQTPTYKNATHLQRKEMIKQATQTAGKLFAGDIAASVRALSAPYAKEAAEEIAWRLIQLGSKAKEARVEVGSVSSGGTSGRQARLPMPDETMDPDGFRRWRESGGTQV